MGEYRVGSEVITEQDIRQYAVGLARHEIGIDYDQEVHIDIDSVRNINGGLVIDVDVTAADWEVDNPFSLDFSLNGNDQDLGVSFYRSPLITAGGYRKYDMTFSLGIMGNQPEQLRAQMITSKNTVDDSKEEGGGCGCGESGTAREPAPLPDVVSGDDDSADDDVAPPDDDVAPADDDSGDDDTTPVDDDDTTPTDDDDTTPTGDDDTGIRTVEHACYAIAEDAYGMNFGVYLVSNPSSYEDGNWSGTLQYAGASDGSPEYQMSVSPEGVSIRGLGESGESMDETDMNMTWAETDGSGEVVYIQEPEADGSNVVYVTTAGLGRTNDVTDISGESTLVDSSCHGFSVVLDGEDVVIDSSEGPISSLEIICCETEVSDE